MNRKTSASYSAAASLDLLKHVTSERRIQNLLGMVEAGAVFAIRDFAIELRLSPCYLQRLFKKETGVRLGEWLGERRLQRAAHLLGNSHLSIKEITHEVGYEHTSSFNRAFERRFLQAPAHFRKQVERERAVEQALWRANGVTRIGRR
jgi:AraC family transcriptional activator of mar-sox-rob regulon